MPVSVKYLHIVGNRIYAHGTDDTENEFVLSSGDFYMPGAGASSYAAAPPPPTPPPVTAIQDALVNWMVAHIGVYAYSQSGGRLNPDVSGYTDCSGLTWYCYKMVTGSEATIPLVNGNTYTGTQSVQGTEIITTTANFIDESIMRNGDLVFFDWGSYTSTFDHVEMYMGSNQTIGHGGPGYGPHIHNFENNVSYASRVRVCRYV